MKSVYSFKFKVPKELIAQKPVSPRDNARLLVYERATGNLYDDYFYNLDKYLVKNTTLVINDSKVEKCRYKFGSVEVFVTQLFGGNSFEALVKPGRKFTPKNVFIFNGLELKTVSIEPDGQRIIESNLPISDKSLDRFCLTPFPPYIKQNESLASEYQTVFARPIGSKAAPTAGLHFTNQQLNDLSKNHLIAKVTLHVSLGTFGKLSDNQIKTGKLHSERFEISKSAADILNSAKHLTAVGTTSARVLESVKRPFTSLKGETDIFIMPGYEFKAVNSLITNFHLPGTSLLMLVAAFVGSTKETQRIYQHAIANKYRFYSFGDAMLIL